jgi:hypothetical protein
MGGNEWWSVGTSSNYVDSDTASTYYITIPAQTLVAAGPAHPESNLEWLDRRVEELRVTL